MTIMGLLQNTWARNPRGVEEMMRRNPGRRNKLIASLLFSSKCTTGRRLQDVFGPLCDTIVWENATPIVTARPGTQVAGDPAHVQAALERIKPDVVLAFGTLAYNTLYAAQYRGCIVMGPHPANRRKNTQQRLQDMQQTLEEKTKE